MESAKGLRLFSIFTCRFEWELLPIFPTTLKFWSRSGLPIWRLELERRIYSLQLVSGLGLPLFLTQFKLRCHHLQHWITLTTTWKNGYCDCSSAPVPTVPGRVRSHFREPGFAIIGTQPILQLNRPSRHKTNFHSFGLIIHKKSRFPCLEIYSWKQALILYSSWFVEFVFFFAFK